MGHEHGNEHLDKPADKLQLIKSPIVSDRGSDTSSVNHEHMPADLEGMGYRDSPGHAPLFQKVRTFFFSLKLSRPAHGEN